MQFGNFFKKTLVLPAAVAVVCWICIGQSALAGSIVSFGRMSVNNSDFVQNDFVSIATGRYHNLALRKDGSIVGWGDNWHGQAMPPDGNDFVAISAGGWHSLALRSNGSIVGWGNNDYGQGTPPEGNDFMAIAAGGHHSLALR
ncbi:MAG: fibronectin type III domain-containing protein, partial [Planctomycetota bacterium]